MLDDSDLTADSSECVRIFSHYVQVGHRDLPSQYRRALPEGVKWPKGKYI